MNNESISSLMKMDLKNLTPNSFREGDSSIYAQFLKHSPPRTTSKVNNTLIKKSKKETNKDVGVLVFSDKNLIMITKEDEEYDHEFSYGEVKSAAAKSLPDRESVFLLDEDQTFNFQ